MENQCPSRIDSRQQKEQEQKASGDGDGGASSALQMREARPFIETHVDLIQLAAGVPVGGKLEFTRGGLSAALTYGREGDDKIV
jgi:hypothetical protein